MKKLILHVDYDKVSFLEDRLCLEETEGFEVQNDQEALLFSQKLYEDERPDIQAATHATILVYGEFIALQKIRAKYEAFLLSSSLEDVEEINWNQKWAESFRPFEAGRNFYIHPPWAEGHPGRLNLTIDPGMAFGTGSHETTRACLLAMEKYLREGMKVLDVGTGSGILAIAAKKMGANEVIGVEIDALALENARHNADINQVEIAFYRAGNLSGVAGSYDMILANILPEVLLELREEIVDRLQPQGVVILSGILDKRVEKVLHAYRELQLLEIIPEGDWRALVLKRK